MAAAELKGEVDKLRQQINSLSSEGEARSTVHVDELKRLQVRGRGWEGGEEGFIHHTPPLNVTNILLYWVAPPPLPFPLQSCRR